MIARIYARWLRFWHCLFRMRRGCRYVTLTSPGLLPHVEAIACDCGRIFWESDSSRRHGGFTRWFMYERNRQ